MRQFTLIVAAICILATGATPVAAQVTPSQYKHASEIKDPAAADASIAKAGAHDAKKADKKARAHARKAKRQAQKAQAQGASGQ